MNEQQQTQEQAALDQLMEKIGGRPAPAATVDKEQLQRYSDEMLDSISRGDRATFQAAKEKFEAVRRGERVADHAAENAKLRKLAEDAGYSPEEIDTIIADEGGTDDDDN